MDFCPISEDLRRLARQETAQAQEESYLDKLGDSAESEAIAEEHRTEFISWAMAYRFESDFLPTKKAFYEAVESGDVELWD